MIHEEELLSHYIKIAELIALVFGPHVEVVVHDFRQPGSSIIAIFNSHVSNRKVGGRTSDIGYQRLMGQFPDLAINYPNKGPKGEVLKSSGLAIRNKKGDLIGTLGINVDITLYEKMAEHLRVLLQTNPIPGKPQKEDFHFLEDSRDLRRLIQDTVIQLNLHAKKLSKQDKITIIQTLKGKGVFKIRGAVQLVAESLQMSKPGVYQHLQGVR